MGNQNNPEGGSSDSERSGSGVVKPPKVRREVFEKYGSLSEDTKRTVYSNIWYPQSSLHNRPPFEKKGVLVEGKEEGIGKNKRRRKKKNKNKKKNKKKMGKKKKKGMSVVEMLRLKQEMIKRGETGTQVITLTRGGLSKKQQGRKHRPPPTSPKMDNPGMITVSTIKKNAKKDVEDKKIATRKNEIQKSKNGNGSVRRPKLKERGRRRRRRRVGGGKRMVPAKTLGYGSTPRAQPKRKPPRVPVDDSVLTTKRRKPGRLAPTIPKIVVKSPEVVVKTEEVKQPVRRVYKRRDTVVKRMDKYKKSRTLSFAEEEQVGSFLDAAKTGDLNEVDKLISEKKMTLNSLLRSSRGSVFLFKELKKTSEYLKNLPKEEFNKVDDLKQSGNLNTSNTQQQQAAAKKKKRMSFNMRLNIVKELIKNQVGDCKSGWGFDTLYYICESEETKEVKNDLIDTLIELTIERKTGLSFPLMEAVENDYLFIIKKLVMNGADVNFQNAKGDTPLHIAGRLNYSQNQFDIIEFLLQNGADPLKNNLAKQTVLNVVAVDNRKTRNLIKEYERKIRRARQVFTRCENIQLKGIDSYNTGLAKLKEELRNRKQNKIGGEKSERETPKKEYSDEDDTSSEGESDNEEGEDEIIEGRTSYYDDDEEFEKDKKQVKKNFVSMDFSGINDAILKAQKEAGNFKSEMDNISSEEEETEQKNYGYQLGDDGEYDDIEEDSYSDTDTETGSDDDEDDY